MDTLARVKEIMSIVFEVPLESIQDDTADHSIESWDSLRHLNLILALEEAFAISIPDEEMGNLSNVPLIVLIVNEALAKKK
jgi:acyl carrier protein